MRLSRALHTKPLRAQRAKYKRVQHDKCTSALKRRTFTPFCLLRLLNSHNCKDCARRTDQLHRNRFNGQSSHCDGLDTLERKRVVEKKEEVRQLEFMYI